MKAIWAGFDKKEAGAVSIMGNQIQETMPVEMEDERLLEKKKCDREPEALKLQTVELKMKEYARGLRVLSRELVDGYSHEVQGRSADGCGQEVQGRSVDGCGQEHQHSLGSPMVLVEEYKNWEKCQLFSQFLQDTARQMEDLTLGLYEPLEDTTKKQAKFVPLTGYARMTKEGESISGDNYAFLENDSRLYVLLSDGTGSGEAAFRDSERVLDLVEELLETGCSFDYMIQMVNQLVLYCGNELCHPTLDFCTIDLTTGEAQFVKQGGCTTYIKNKDRIECVSKQAIPLGISLHPRVMVEKRVLQAGDILVFTSDGIGNCLGMEQGEALVRKSLEECQTDHPGKIAQDMIQMAIYANEGHIKDDCTVLSVGIWERY